METPPLVFQWDGEALVPASGFWRREADHHLCVGQRYRMVEENEQSDKSRSHEFAWLREAWNSLPDALLDQYPSSEHLRKYGLIAKGHCTMTQHPCVSVAEAERTEVSIRKHVAKYAMVFRRGSIVTVYEAVSQSRRSMGAPMFQQSKSDLMDFVADLLGVPAETLAKLDQAA